MAALRRCGSYRVGPHLFPAVAIDEGDIGPLLDRLAFDDPRRRTVEARSLEGPTGHGHDGILLLACERLAMHAEGAVRRAVSPSS